MRGDVAAGQQWAEGAHLVWGIGMGDCRLLFPHTAYGCGKFLGSGLIDHSQKITIVAMQMADMNVSAHLS